MSDSDEAVTKSSKRVSIQCANEVVVVVQPAHILLRCETLKKDVLQRLGTNDPEPIVVSKVDSSVLREIVEYCRVHWRAEADVQELQPRVGRRQLNEYVQKFVSEKDANSLFSFIVAADHLKVSDLLDALCEEVADRYIKGKTPEEIRYHLNIKNDWAEDEDERVVQVIESFQKGDKEDKNYNMLHQLALEGDEPVVSVKKLLQALLDKGEDPNARESKDLTPLDMAAMMGHDHLLEQFVQLGAAVNSKDKTGKTALHKAAQNGKSKCAERLIQVGCDIDALDNDGFAAIHYAAMAGSLETMVAMAKLGCNYKIKALGPLMSGCTAAAIYCMQRREVHKESLVEGRLARAAEEFRQTQNQKVDENTDLNQGKLSNDDSHWSLERALQDIEKPTASDRKKCTSSKKKKKKRKNAKEATVKNVDELDTENDQRLSQYQQAQYGEKNKQDSTDEEQEDDDDNEPDVEPGGESVRCHSVKLQFNSDQNSIEIRNPDEFQKQENGKLLTKPSQLRQPSSSSSSSSQNFLYNELSQLDHNQLLNNQNKDYSNFDVKQSQRRQSQGTIIKPNNFKQGTLQSNVSEPKKQINGTASAQTKQVNGVQQYKQQDLGGTQQSPFSSFQGMCPVSTTVPAANTKVPGSRIQSRPNSQQPPIGLDNQPQSSTPLTMSHSIPASSKLFPPAVSAFTPLPEGMTLGELFQKQPALVNGEKFPELPSQQHHQQQKRQYGAVVNQQRSNTIQRSTSADTSYASKLKQGLPTLQDQKGFSNSSESFVQTTKNEDNTVLQQQQQLQQQQDHFSLFSHPIVNKLNQGSSVQRQQQQRLYDQNINQFLSAQEISSDNVSCQNLSQSQSQQQLPLKQQQLPPTFEQIPHQQLLQSQGPIANSLQQLTSQGLMFGFQGQGLGQGQGQGQIASGSMRNDSYSQVYEKSIFHCPITQQVMKEPVIAADGNTYDLDAIWQWLMMNDTSPVTGEILVHKKLVPNRTLKSIISSLVLTQQL